MYVKPTKYTLSNAPFGVNRPLKSDRIPVVKVMSGDTWTVDFNLFDPVSAMPATPDTTVVRFVLSENKFTPPLWEGGWSRGVEPSATVPGLVHVRIPQEISSSLRRGTYAFSVAVVDRLGMRTETQAEGNFLVEYSPSSPMHDIPYRTDDATDEENDKSKEAEDASKV